MIFFLIVLLSGAHAYDFPEERRCEFLGDPGWRCGGVGHDQVHCIPAEWVCDGDVQCPLHDGSDEQEGCQLYGRQENGNVCKSRYGREHFPCPESGECVDDIAQCGQSGAQRVCGGRVGTWRCLSGACITTNLTCDGVPHCDDGSDETTGCRLFGDSRCKSWFGRHYAPCANTSICAPVDFLITDPDCRSCASPSEWRCDDGRCIPIERVQDGLKDCRDGSDEDADAIKWWTMVLITAGVALVGIALSFLHRFINKKKNILDFNLLFFIKLI